MQLLDVTVFLGWVSNLIAICSVLHLILPSYEIFDDFPTFKKYYKIVVLIIGGIALNRRESVVGVYNRMLGKAPLQDEPPNPKV